MARFDTMYRVKNPVSENERGSFFSAFVTADGASTPPAGAWLYLAVLLVFIVITAGLWPLRQMAGLLNAGLVYLVAIIAVTVFAGRRPGLFASLLGFALLDYFLVPPYLTFIIGDFHNILALFVFLGVSLLISQLLSGAREQAARARAHAEDTQRLYELSQAIGVAQDVHELTSSIARKVCEVLAAQASFILLPDASGQLAVTTFYPASAPPLSPADMASSRAIYAQQGAGAAQGPEGEALSNTPSGTILVPLRSGAHMVGVLAVVGSINTNRYRRRLSDIALLYTFAAQAALAVERLHLQGEAQRAEMLARTDELKTALMSAVSHDLRTPLASITASVTSLLDRDIDWDDETKREFLQGIFDEAWRLNRLVGNLLDMSRIEGGSLHPEKEWYSLGEVIESVLARLESALAPYKVTVDIQPDLPLVMLDFVEIDQVLTNLLENAIKYTPAHTSIELHAKQVGGQMQVTVQDSGPGVPPEALPHLFDKFYRVDRKSESLGTGLGLAIAKGLVEAHGGTITAENAHGGGLRVMFTLPMDTAPTLHTGAGASASAEGQEIPETPEMPEMPEAPVHA